MVSGKFTLRKIAPGLLTPRQLSLRIIDPEENYPPDNCSLDDCFRTITPNIIAPLTICPWKLPPRKIVFRMICCLHNCPEENCPLEHCPKDKLHTIYFFYKNQKSQYFNRWLLPFVLILCGLS